MDFLIIANWVDSEYDRVCLFTLYRVIFPVIEMSLRTICQKFPRAMLLLCVYRVSVLQASYCFRDLLYTMLTHLLCNYALCS